jgi:glycosyltransferase involved in cell wall biosynthesis
MVAAAKPGNVASVIITCGAKLDPLRTCIASVMRYHRGARELLVTDSDRSKRVTAYLAGVRDASPIPVTIFPPPKRLRLSTSYATVARAARGDYLVFLHDHAIVTDGWLEQLIALAGADPAIGITAPMSNAGPGPQRVPHAPGAGAGVEQVSQFAERWRQEHRGQWLTTEHLGGPCLLIRRKALEVISAGERLRPSLLRWRRLGARATQKGYQLAVARDLYVHRSSFATHGMDERAPLDAVEDPPTSVAIESVDARLAGAPLTAFRPSSEQSRTIPPSLSEARRVRVSLTMIVKNEEANLPACLNSARGVFDEIIVLDTGSTDRTAEIARSFGARVFDFVWVNDFAAARNAALARATGDYAFWLDADDVLDPPERHKLLALLRSLKENDEAAYVVRCACDPDNNGGGGATVVDHVRLFPVREDVRWSYAVHEQILPGLRRVGVPVRWSDVTVRHTGYTNSQLRNRKLERDEAILQAELAERPDDPFVLFNLGSIAIERSDWRQALAHLRRSLALSGPDDSITRKLYALIARSHQLLGEPSAALGACAEGLAIDPDDAELLFREAVIRRNLGDNRGAESCWSRVLGLKRPERFSSVDAGIYGHLTRRNLAALAQERGDATTAIRLWSEVLTECPGDREAIEARTRLGYRGR